MTQCVVRQNLSLFPLLKKDKTTLKHPYSNQNSKIPLWFSLGISQELKMPSTPHHQPIFPPFTSQPLLEPLFTPSTKFRYFPSLSLPFTFDLFTRNRLYREKYRGFESHRLHHKKVTKKILCPQKATQSHLWA